MREMGSLGRIVVLPHLALHAPYFLTKNVPHPKHEYFFSINKLLQVILATFTYNQGSLTRCWKSEEEIWSA
jgi:hypothetical protein